ncbi:MAG: hypothetical protein EXR62_14050 [Chloroflexi bacterium]|nr:hypothetical protein [Chloroflexota bacterium]
MKITYRRATSEIGSAMIWTLIALSMGMLLLVPLLTFVSTNLIATKTRTELVSDYYTADSGIEAAIRNAEINPASFPLPPSLTPLISVSVPITTLIGGRLPTVFMTRTAQVSGGTSGTWSSQSNPVDTNLNGCSLILQNSQDLFWTVGDQGAILYYDGSGFVQQNSPTTKKLTGVSFVNSTTGFAVGQRNGSNPTILATSDSGTTWSLKWQSTNFKKNLNSVSFANSTTGWAVGENGTIIKTINSATSWDTQYNPTNLDLYGVSFANNALNGFVVGQDGTILITSNGGTTWTASSSPAGAADLNGVYILHDNPNLGWAAGNSGVILRTTDGGQTWNLSSNSQQLTSNKLYSIYFADSNNGWAVGEAIDDITPILRSTDGGVTWDLDGNPTDHRIQCIVGNSTSDVWAAGEKGSILTYNGLVWTDQQSLWSGTVKGIQVYNGSQAIAIGEQGRILLYDGSSWADPYVWSGGQNLNTIAYRNNHFAIAGDQGLVLLYDGQSFTQATTNSSRRLNSITYASDQELWAVSDKGGDSCDPGRATILHSTDGGQNWSCVATGINGDLEGVDFTSTGNGWAVGESGTLLQYTAGSWVSASSGSSYDLMAIDMLSATQGWIVGKHGTILKFNGTVWTPQSSGVTDNLYSVFFLDQNTGWAVGQNGTILEYSNSVWSQTSSATNKDIFGIAGTSACIMLAVGEDGTVVTRYCQGECNLFTVTSSVFSTKNPSLKTADIEAQVKICNNLPTTITAWVVK